MPIKFSNLPPNVQRKIILEHRELGVPQNQGLKKPKADHSSPYADIFGKKLKIFIPDLQKEYKQGVPGRRYRLDFAIPEIKLAIEIDGYRSHGLSIRGFHKDRVRNNLLVVNGWRILHFSIRDLTQDMDGCIQFVRDAAIKLKT